jgi:hypothetical protein
MWCEKLKNIKRQIGQHFFDDEIIVLNSLIAPTRTVLQLQDVNDEGLVCLT